MTDQEINEAVIRRFLSAQTLPGRLSLNSRVRFKRLAWRAVVASSFFIKRLVDIAGSVILIIAFSPVFTAIAIAIRLEDGGPIFFHQVRVGRLGRHFRMHKFRSMCIDADQKKDALLEKNQHQDGITFKIKNDPRVTRIGKWIRKTSMDELPQFFNVLKGEMSLVGPRPPVPREVALYTLEDRRRLAVTPGITCLWQVGGRSEIDFKGQVRLDVQYIENQSFWGDVKILFKTIPAVLGSKGAY